MTQRVSITWLGHATMAIDIGEVRLLTDPVLGVGAGPLARFTSRPRVRHWAGARAVLLSHLHHDHADLPSLRRLRGVPVLTSPGNGSWLARHGLAGARLAGEGWRPIADDVQVRLVRADHDSRPMPHRPNHANGFLIRAGGVTVWFAGDTALYDGIAGLAELAGGAVDVALVPIGGWGPRLSAGHLGPAEAAQACAWVGARHVVPMHYGTLYPRSWPRSLLGWLHAPLQVFADLLPTWTAARLHPLEVGGSVTLGPRTPHFGSPG
jgi:L-ascorbate metabolism protein UlaG (beta-lactamase superfamily)